MIASILILTSLWPCVYSDPCNQVVCNFNGLCGLNTETEEYGCLCPREECFGSEYYPICGSDNNTYNNSCEMMMQSCLIQSNVFFLHNGKCGYVECENTEDCHHHAECIDGICKCLTCQPSRFLDHRTLFGSKTQHNSPVCGTDLKTYSSECLMKQKSCRQRMPILVRKMGPCNKRSIIPVRRSKIIVNQLKKWMQIDEPTRVLSNRNAVDNTVLNPASQDLCVAVNLRGCVLSSFKRKEFLGVYQRTNTVLHHAPVYKLLGRQPRKPPAYLSRYVSEQNNASSWIVGSKIDSGTGWIGSRDSAMDPSNVKSTWSATTGNRGKIWREEPSIKSQCIFPKVSIETAPDCIPGFESGHHSRNYLKNKPIYNIKISPKNIYRGKYYKPNKRITVKVETSFVHYRISAMYLHMSNSDGTCLVPFLAKGKTRYSILCNGSLITRKSAKGKTKMAITLKTPARGCVTLRFFIKSKSGKVFYDKFPITLTKTICDENNILILNENSNKTKKLRKETKNFKRKTTYAKSTLQLKQAFEN